MLELGLQPLAGDGLVIAARGEIDAFTAPEVRAALDRAINDGIRRIVVDLTETTFLDSTALGVLIGAVRRLRAHEGSLAIVNVDDGIAETFVVTGLDAILTIRSTRDAALAALDGACV